MWMANSEDERLLLEAAANASGCSITGWNRRYDVDVAVLSDGSFWQPLLKNPITDCMGDALRLAVDLGFINPGQWPDASHFVQQQMTQGRSVDWSEATCRAIVEEAARRWRLSEIPSRMTS